MGKKFIQRPLDEYELNENEEAIKWLAKKGLTPYEIKYLKWHWIDTHEMTITIPRETKRGRRYNVRFSYFGSPMMVVADRSHGKNIFVLSKTTMNPNHGFAKRFSYKEQEIVALVTEERRKKVMQKRKKVLTISGNLIIWGYRNFYK